MTEAFATAEAPVFFVLQSFAAMQTFAPHTDADGFVQEKAQSLYEGSRYRSGFHFDLLSMQMQREQDEEGKFHIRWGEQLAI